MRHSKHVEQDASGGMFGYRATMDADAGAVGDVEDFGEELIELGREGFVEGVRAFRDEEIPVFEGLDGDVAVIHGYRHRAGDGLAINGGAG